jgi:hypothetical protein
MAQPLRQLRGVIAMGRKLPSGTFEKGVPELDLVRVSELIEASRAHTATVQDLADITSQSLHKCFEYESGEPHLGKCIDVVRELLNQVLKALPPLGIVSHDADPQSRAKEITVGCEGQRKLLHGAWHVTIATIYILKRAGLDPSDQNIEILASLSNLEDGIRTIFDSLNPITLALPAPAAS